MIVRAYFHFSSNYERKRTKNYDFLYGNTLDILIRLLKTTHTKEKCSINAHVTLSSDYVRNEMVKAEVIASFELQ